MTDTELKDLGKPWKEIEKKAKDMQIWTVLVETLCAVEDE